VIGQPRQRKAGLEPALAAVETADQPRVSRRPGLGIGRRQQRAERRHPGEAEGRESAPQLADRRIADGDAAPADAAAAQAAEGRPRLAAEQEPQPLPRHQRSHHAQHGAPARPHRARHRRGDGRQIADAVEGTEVRHHAVEGSFADLELFDRRPADLDQRSQPGVVDLRPRRRHHLRRAVDGYHLDAAVRQVDGVLAGPATEIEDPVAGGEDGVQAAPDRAAQAAAEDARGEAAVVVGGQGVESGFRLHRSNSGPFSRWLRCVSSA